MVHDWDIGRQALLRGKGYQNLGTIEDVRIYDLTRDYPAVGLPPGFRFASMTEDIPHQERVELENSVWGTSLPIWGRC